MFAVLAMNPESSVFEFVLVDLHDTEEEAQAVADEITGQMNPGYIAPVKGDPATNKDWDALVKGNKPRSWIQGTDIDRDLAYKLLGLEPGLVPLQPLQ